MNSIYDMIVIGGGPAGYTAALYAVRSGLSTLVIERMGAGGQMTQTLEIDNYPGFDEGIDGFTLGMKMQSGAEKFGCKTVLAEVTGVNLEGAVKEIETSEGIYKAKTVVIATGAKHRHLGIPDEDALIGRGVGYCATCDGMFYRGKTVAVVGGGNTAAADALALSRVAKKVYLIHRRDALRATKIYHDALSRTENIEFKWNSTVSAFTHDQQLTGAILTNVSDGSKSELALDGLFVSIGMDPVTELFKGQLELDESGYIVSDESTRTNLPGVYAAGDVRTKKLRQIITAAADGAVSAHYAEEYLSELS